MAKFERTDEVWNDEKSQISESLGGLKRFLKSRVKLLG